MEMYKDRVSLVMNHEKFDLFAEIHSLSSNEAKIKAIYVIFPGMWPRSIFVRVRVQPLRVRVQEQF